MNKNNLGLILAISIVVGFGLACSRFSQMVNNAASNSGNSNTQSPKIGTFSLADKAWNTYDLENTDIKIDLPAKPSDKSPTDAQLPPSYKEFFSGIHVHALDYVDFSVGSSELVPTKKRKFTLKELADTAMTAMKRQLPDLKYNVDIKSDSNAKYTGTFTKGPRNFELRGCAVYKKSDPARMWAIIAFYDKTNEDARTAAERSTKSVIFKDSAEKCE